MEIKSPPARLEIVDFLRGIAALSVAWFHFTNGGGLLGAGWLKSSGTYGWLGVEVFFVISGFVIPYSMFQGGYVLRQHLAAFLAKRIVRLEPPYLIAIVLSLLLWYLSSMAPGFRGVGPDVSITQLLLHLGYLNSIFGLPWVNVVFWSLAIEFQYYLLIAIGFPAFIHKSPLVRVAALMVFCFSGLLFDNPVHVFHYAVLFGLGIVAFWKLVGIVSVRSYLLMTIAITSLGVITLGTSFALVGVASNLIIGFVRVSNCRPLAFLGAISYSLYLVHVPIGGRVINLGARFADSLTLQISVLIAAVAASLLSAYVMYVLIERPSARWSRSFAYAHWKYAGRR